MSGHCAITGSLHVWRFDFRPSHAQIALLHETLSPDEQKRANKLVFKEKRDQFIVARGILRITLAKYLDTELSELLFYYGEHGKHSIVGHPNGIEFSLSHSKLIGLIGVAQNRRVGIDVDQLGRVTNWTKVAKKHYSISEQNQLFSLTQAERESAFSDVDEKRSLYKSTWERLQLWISRLQETRTFHPLALLVSTLSPVRKSDIKLAS